MHLGKYFRKETFTYWFLALLPVILVTELWLYFVGTNKLYGEASECFAYFLWPLSLMASGVLIFIQLVSVSIYFVRWCRLTSEQKKGLRDAACNAKKTGRILQSEEVLLYYGMFSKKVLFKREITSMERFREQDFRRVRGGSISTESDFIRVSFKSGKKADLICNKKVLDGYQGEIPWNSIGAVVLLGVAELVMGFYPLLMNCFVSKKDLITRILFFAGYEWVFWLISAFLIAVFTVYLYHLKKKYLDESYRGIISKSALPIYLAFLVLLFSGIVFRDKYDESQLARADLKAYTQGQYEKQVTYMRKLYYEPIWTCGTDYIYHYLETEQISYVCPECIEDGSRYDEDFMLVGFEESPELDQTYCLYYLENTRIIVSFEKVENEKR